MVHRSIWSSHFCARTLAWSSLSFLRQNLFPAPCLLCLIAWQKSYPMDGSFPRAQAAIRYSKNWYFPLLHKLHNIWVFVLDSTNVQCANSFSYSSDVSRSFPILVRSSISSFVFCSKTKSTAGLLGLSQFQFHQSPVSQERFGVTRVGLHG